MNTMGLLAISFVTLWLLLLTLSIILIIRQIGILTVQVSTGQANAHEFLQNDGPEVDRALPNDVLQRLPTLIDVPTCIILISSTCTTCRELVTELYHQPLAVRTVALLAGSDELANPLSELLPSSIEVIRDPEASEMASSLRIQSTPFGFVVEEGIVRQKSYLYTFESLLDLTNAYTSIN